jgi:hypothetical protein
MNWGVRTLNISFSSTFWHLENEANFSADLAQEIALREFSWFKRKQDIHWKMKITSNKR